MKKHVSALNNFPSKSIQASELVCEYSPGRGVAGVSLDIEAGECYAVLGRNGSGKSTLTRLLLRLERFTSGSLSVLGYGPGTSSRKFLSKTGVVLDTSIHWEQLTGWENAYFIARNYKIPRTTINSRLNELFETADLSEYADEPVKTYSYGMRRKLGFIEALCHEPDLLVLDEPTTGLDAQFIMKLTDVILHRSQGGLTTWITGNDPDWITGVASRVAFMESGKIIEEGTVDELVKEVSKCQEIKVILAQPKKLPLPDFPGIHSFVQTGETLTAILEHDPRLVPVMMDWIISCGSSISTIEVHQSSLRDAYLLKTGRTVES